MSKVKSLAGLVDLLCAVGHIGTDFGHGFYQLSSDQIREAQEYHTLLKSLLDEGMEPVGYEYRMRATWSDQNHWTNWDRCSAEAYAEYKASPLDGDWEYEARALYLTPQVRVPDAKPLPELMMSSYHEAIGWNACREAMLKSQIGE